MHVFYGQLRRLRLSAIADVLIHILDMFDVTFMLFLDFLGVLDSF